MPAGLGLAVTNCSESDVVVAVAGEVDMVTAPQLLDCLLSLTGRSITVDLTGVTFLDSSGVAALVSGYNGARVIDRTFRVVNANDAVRRVLELCGLEEYLSPPEP
jgi:anti-sigma B factor antagonist